ncbi:TadE-like protein [Mesobacillus persicus]|uniref:TadE-like protein n=1 Tax=Mesobacillus persicus TaxID=930146 RepID=A0A1H8CGL8_9BACI|nr:TadE/TadG family type IV pilus assembly protein [Mesobacillus persicus]SEM94146.1 TadE-like protein [Mesobacillus persicus]
MKSEKGQSLVEFALVVPILALLLFGIVDFGRIFHAYLTIDHAGREAARAASIGKSKTEVELVAVKSGSSINLTIGDVVVVPGASGSDAKITITYPIAPITPIIGTFFSEGFILIDTTVMRVE